MEGSEAVRAIRQSVAVSRLDHVRIVRVGGDQAVEALERVIPRGLYLREGQLLQTVLLDEEGRVFADVLLAADEEDWFLLAEGPDGPDLVAYLRRHADGIPDVDIVDETPHLGLIGLDGPYAWELLARWAGQEVIGLPYLTFYRIDGVVCCRAGKTGEYGYVLVVPRADAEALESKLLVLGAEMEVGRADLGVLDQCALENWFFNIRREGRAEVTPLELQLQWRISRKREYVGREALRERMTKGVLRRVTTVVGQGPIGVGDAVVEAGDVVGTILNAGFSEPRGDWVGLALLDVAIAHPGVPELRIGPDGLLARTVTPPVLDNRSLYVNPQVHGFASRHEDDFPPIALS